MHLWGGGEPEGPSGGKTPPLCSWPGTETESSPITSLGWPRGQRPRCREALGEGLRLPQTDQQTDKKVKTLALLSLPVPASAHGSHHSSVEVAPGSLCGWCEVRTQALLQHVEQGLTHCLRKQAVLSHRKASLHLQGRKLKPWARKGTQAFLLFHTGLTLPKQVPSVTLSITLCPPSPRDVRMFGGYSIQLIPVFATTP